MMSRSSSVYSRYLIIFVSILLILGTMSISSSSAYASSSSSQNKCVVTWIFLHGHNPATIQCHKFSAEGSGPITIPDTGTVNCNSGFDALLYSYDNGEVCFIGSGYLGLYSCCTRVFNIDFVHYGGWVLYYHGGGGARYYFYSGQYISNEYPFDGTAKVTQVCIRYANGSGCEL